MVSEAKESNGGERDEQSDIFCVKIEELSELLGHFCIFKLKIEENENMAFSKKLQLFDNQLISDSN